MRAFLIVSAVSVAFFAGWATDSVLPVSEGWPLSFQSAWWGYNFVYDFARAKGYREGKADYIGTAWSVHRANVRCNSQGGIDASDFDFAPGAHLRLDEAVAALFSCPDNWDREK